MAENSSLKEVKTSRKVELAYRRMQVADMYLRGLSQPEIAQKVGVNQSQVSRDLKKLREEWLDRSIQAIDRRKAEELAKIDKLEMEYWDAWERSKKDSETTTIERYGSPPTSGAFGSVVPSKIKEVKKKEGRDGTAMFLAGVQWCIEQRCAIIGVYAPKSGAMGTIDLSKLSDRQLERLAAGENLYDVLASAS